MQTTCRPFPTIFRRQEGLNQCTQPSTEKTLSEDVILVSHTIRPYAVSKSALPSTLSQTSHSRYQKERGKDKRKNNKTSKLHHCHCLFFPASSLPRHGSMQNKQVANSFAYPTIKHWPITWRKRRQQARTYQTRKTFHSIYAFKVETNTVQSPPLSLSPFFFSFSLTARHFK